MYEFLMDDFYQRMDGVKLDAFGILDSQNRIHTLGTDSKIIGRIFEMFAQPVLAEIAAAHGGTLELTSRPGQGTAAKIRLPKP